MTSKPKSAKVVDMAQARRERDWMELEKGLKQQNGTPLSQWRTYTPMAPYLLEPCRVFELPVKKPDEKVLPGTKP